MTDKPGNATGYTARQATLVRRTCLYLATRLGDFADDLVVVGGMVPSLLIDQDHQPAVLLEAKSPAATEPATLSNFRRQLNLDRAYLVVGTGGIDSRDRSSSIRTISADRFLASLV